MNLFNSGNRSSAEYCLPRLKNNGNWQPNCLRYMIRFDKPVKVLLWDTKPLSSQSQMKYPSRQEKALKSNPNIFDQNRLHEKVAYEILRNVNMSVGLDSEHMWLTLS
jgi:hypothetical protein